MVIALTLPGMVNMSAVKVSIEQGIRAGLKFSLGGTIAMVLQAYLAITFAKFLSANPYVILYLKRAALAIFLILSITFFYLAKKTKIPKEKYKKRENTPFIFGFVIMGMNMLNIPFLFATSTLLEAKGWVSVEAPDKWLFVLGIALGSWSLLVAYAKFSDIITRRAQFVARHLNYFLSGLFMLLALIQIVFLLNGL
jgi:threonine/homoserine/homoserine lactone efflux protein